MYHDVEIQSGCVALLQDKWTSEPDLAGGRADSSKSSSTSRGSWLQRHLSLKRSSKKSAAGRGGTTAGKSLDEGLASSSQRSGSAPLLITISPVNSPPSTPGGGKSLRRPSCVDGVVAVSIVPAAAAGPRGAGAGRAGCAAAAGGTPRVIYEEPQAPPPQILATDFDLELETSRF